VKALTNVAPTSLPLWKGSAAALRDIEILPTDSGAPAVLLHGHARSVAQVLAVQDVRVTISHCGNYAIAQAVAR
jgi:phosphopantetheine--protein transferase-like protein